MNSPSTSGVRRGPRRLLTFALALLGIAGAFWGWNEATRHPVLLDVGPRIISNQTSQPLTLYGRRFRQGMKLHISSAGQPEQDYPVVVKGPSEAYVRLPPEALAIHDRFSEQRFTLSLHPGDGQSRSVLVVNDDRYPEPTALVISPSGGQLAALSPTTDALMLWEVGARDPHRIKTGDGPTAIAAYEDAGQTRFAVVHAFEPSIRIYGADGAEVARLPGPLYATGIQVHEGVAYVAERVTNTVRALSLRSPGKELWRTEVAPHPRELAIVGATLAVGSMGSGEIEILDLATGQKKATVAPSPATHIVGGHTEKFAPYIMGGKAVRSLAVLPQHRVLLVSSIGPNIGPNPDKMEVSMNSGVGVVDTARGLFVRHRGLGAGVTEGLVADEPHGLVYQADIGSGTVQIYSLAALLQDDESARGALLQTLPIPAPPGGLLVRPRTDFGTPKGVGLELHSGPRALALSPDGHTLYVLTRFTGALVTVDVTDAEHGQAHVVKQLTLFAWPGQQERRMGEILYDADLGRTAMSCDACHPAGETEGVLFEKTRPLRIYRSVGVRGALESPPYFTPASADTLEATMKEVGNRNRFHRLPLSGLEIERLTTFTRELAPWPNPYRDAQGAPVERIAFPGGEGNPARGRALFEGKGACVACHPGPHFTLDQDPGSKGKYLSVGTPHLMPLRMELQSGIHPGFAIPSLVGLWNQFPLLGTGMVGFSPRDDGTLETERFPLPRLLRESGPKHGNAAAMSDAERNDLTAYLMTL